jgi:hypothetical protein
MVHAHEVVFFLCGNPTRRAAGKPIAEPVIAAPLFALCDVVTVQTHERFRRVTRARGIADRCSAESRQADAWPPD